METVSTEEGDGHNANQPRKFGFKSLLSVFKFMAGGKLKAGPQGSHSDSAADGFGDLEEGGDDCEDGKCTRNNGYRSVPTSSPRSSRGQVSSEVDSKGGVPKTATPSAKSLVMTPHICRHKSCEHQQPTSHERASCLQRSASENPPSYSSLTVSPNSPSSHSAVAASNRPAYSGRSLTLDLADVISPASDSGTPTPTMPAPATKKKASDIQMYDCPGAGATTGSLQQGGLIYPYAYSPDYEEIETPRRAPNFFRGGVPPPTSRANSSGTLIMGGAFGGKSNRQQQQSQAGYSNYSGGRTLHQHQPDYDFDSYSFQSPRPSYGTGAVPKQNPAPRSGLLVFQKASEIFHRRLEARRHEESASSNTRMSSSCSPPASRDHWSFTESPVTETPPSAPSACNRNRTNSESPKESVVKKEQLTIARPSKEEQTLKKSKDAFSKSPCKDDCLLVKNSSIISPARRCKDTAQSSKAAHALKSSKAQRAMARSLSHQASDEGYSHSDSLSEHAPSQASGPTHMAHLTCLSREEVSSDPDHQPRYSMPYLAESPTMQDEERAGSLQFNFRPISSSKESISSAAQENTSTSHDANRLHSVVPLLYSSEAFDPNVGNFPDLISNELCSSAQASGFSPSKDTAFACSNSSGKTTPDGSDSTVVINTSAASPQQDGTVSSNTFKCFQDSTTERKSPRSNLPQHRSAKDTKLLASNSSPISSAKSSSPTAYRFSQSDFRSGLKQLTRTGSCSSPFDPEFPVPDSKRPSPPSSNSSPDGLHLENEKADVIACPLQKKTALRFSNASRPVALESKSSAQYKEITLARHSSLEKP